MNILKSKLMKEIKTVFQYDCCLCMCVVFELQL